MGYNHARLQESCGHRKEAETSYKVRSTEPPPFVGQTLSRCRPLGRKPALDDYNNLHLPCERAKPVLQSSMALKPTSLFEGWGFRLCLEQDHLIVRVPQKQAWASGARRLCPCLAEMKGIS